jgi:hypothetical protein
MVMADGVVAADMIAAGVVMMAGMMVPVPRGSVRSRRSQTHCHPHEHRDRDPTLHHYEISERGPQGAGSVGQQLKPLNDPNAGTL